MQRQDAGAARWGVRALGTWLTNANKKEALGTLQQDLQVFRWHTTETWGAASACVARSPAVIKQGSSAA